MPVVSRARRTTVLAEMSRGRPGVVVGAFATAAALALAGVALLPEEWTHAITRLHLGGLTTITVFGVTVVIWLLMIVSSLCSRAEHRPTVVSVREAPEHQGALLLVLVEHAERWELGAELAFYEQLDKNDERLVGGGRIVDRLDDGRAHAVLYELSPGVTVDGLKKNPPRIRVREQGTTAALQRQTGGSKMGAQP